VGIRQLVKFRQARALAFFEENLDKVDWAELSGNEILTESFVLKHMDKIDWFNLSHNEAISENFVRHHIDRFDLEELSGRKTLSLEFFEYYYHRLYTAEMAKNIAIPWSFISEHFEDFDHEEYWPGICLKPYIPLNVLEENVDKLSWLHLCKNPTIPLKFFEQHMDQLCWSTLTANEGVPLEFLERHLDKIYWASIGQRLDLTHEFIVEHIEKIIVFPDGIFMSLGFRHVSPETLTFLKKVFEEKFSDPAGPLAKSLESAGMSDSLADVISASLKGVEVMQEDNAEYKLSFGSHKGTLPASKAKSLIPAISNFESFPIELFRKHKQWIDWAKLSRNQFDTMTLFRETRAVSRESNVRRPKQKIIFRTHPLLDQQRAPRFPAVSVEEIENYARS
jgi:hypothetical protein